MGGKKQKAAEAIRTRIVGHSEEDPADLLANPLNFRRHPGQQLDALRGSMKELGWLKGVMVNKVTGHVIDGHARCEEAMRQGVKVPVDWLELTPEEELLALAVLDPITEMAMRDTDTLNQLLAQVVTQDPGLQALLDELAGKTPEEGGSGGGGAEAARASLAEKFGAPPFSVLDTRQGYWQDRKRAWNALIGDHGESRENTLADEGSLMASINNGVSILDAVLAECVVRWFAVKGFKVLDPFVGDSVFGFVASSLGLQFTGIELRKEQADLNQKRLQEAKLPGTYICDTSENMDAHIPDGSMDFVFSCPPYADLEVYSDDPRDLSNMPHEDFFRLYSGILGNTYRKLRPNRFAVVVTSEVRDKKGAYIGLVPGTIKAMTEAGYQFWNEMILINTLSTLPRRVGKMMNASRKVGRCHQNILVFYKGDPKAIKGEFGPACEEEVANG